MCVAAVWVCYARRPFRKYRVLGSFWRARLAADAPADRRRRADLRLVPARIRRVRRRRAADGLDRHRGARRAPDRAADRRRSCSWCRSASRWRRPCASATRSAAAMRRRRGAPASSAIALGVAFMAAMTLLVALTRHTLPLLFLGSRGARPADRRARRLAAGARRDVLHRRRRADGRGGALRGLNDTRVPLLFAAVSFWLIGFAGCWLFGFTLGLGAYGIWIGLSLGIAVYAVLLIWRFHRLTARHYLPEIATAAGMTERLTISRLGHRGDGIADTPDGPVFVPYTLPGEMVEVEPVPGHPDRRHLLRVETREPGAHRAGLSAFRRLRRLPDPALGLRALSRLEARPRRRGAAAGGPRRAGRRPDRRARGGAAARGVPRAAQRRMACSRSALRPIARITSSRSTDARCWRLRLTARSPAAWAHRRSARAWRSRSTSR